MVLGWPHGNVGTVFDFRQEHATVFDVADADGVWTLECHVMDVPCQSSTAGPGNGAPKGETTHVPHDGFEEVEWVARHVVVVVTLIDVGRIAVDNSSGSVIAVCGPIASRHEGGCLYQIVRNVSRVGRD